MKIVHGSTEKFRTINIQYAFQNGKMTMRQMATAETIKDDVINHELRRIFIASEFLGEVTNS